MANLEKYTWSEYCGLMKSDRFTARDGCEHPELAEKNKSWIYYRKDGELKVGVFGWDKTKGAEKYLLARREERLKDVAIYNRPDVKHICTAILTVPLDVRPGDEEKCMNAFRLYCEKKFGLDKAVLFQSHWHEHRPHCTFDFLPVVVDRKKGGERLCYSEIYKRKLFNTFHSEVQRYVDNYLGYHVTIERDEAAKEKSPSNHTINTLKDRSNKARIRVLESQNKFLMKALRISRGRLARFEKEDPEGYNQLKRLYKASEDMPSAETILAEWYAERQNRSNAAARRQGDENVLPPH